MNSYVTGAVIRNLREGKKLTQEELAEKLFVSSTGQKERYPQTQQ